MCVCVRVFFVELWGIFGRICECVIKCRGAMARMEQRKEIFLLEEEAL